MAEKRLVWVGVSELAAITESDRECEEDSVVEELSDEELNALAKRLEGEQLSVLRRMKREATAKVGDVLDGQVVDLCEEEEGAVGGQDNTVECGDGVDGEYDDDVVMAGLDEAKSLVKGMGKHPEPEMRRLRKVVIRTRRRYREMRNEWRGFGRSRRNSDESVDTVREVMVCEDDGRKGDVGDMGERGRDEDEVEDEEVEDQVSVPVVPRSAFGCFKLFGVRRGVEMREVAEALMRAVPEARRLKVEEFVRNVRKLDVRVGGGEVVRGKDNIVVSVPNFVLEGLLCRQGYLEIERERLRVERFWEAQQCLNCWGYRHMSRECIRETRCKRCAGFHHHRHCREAKRRCVNCVEAGVEAGNTGHGARDVACPIFMVESGQAAWEG